MGLTPRSALDRRTLAKVLFGGLLASALPAAARAREGGARRVVSLDLMLTEQLLTLGVPPLAVANIPLYERLVAVPALPSGVEDVGPQQEPNRELMQYLQPDLIVGLSWQAFRQQALARIAPVAFLPPPGRTGAPVEGVQDLLADLGRRTGREQAAETANASLRARLAEARARLVPHVSRPVYFVRFLEDGRHAAVFGTRSLIGDVAARIGLANAWTGRGNASGVATIGIADLAEVPQAGLIHFDRGAETARALARLNDSPFWQALPLVRAGRVVAMPVIYPSGGVASALRLIAQVEAVYLREGGSRV